MVEMGNGSEAMVTDKNLDYIRKRSDVAGSIIIGAAVVNKSVWATEGQTGAFDDEHIEGLTKLAEAGHESGNKIIVQLQHAGRDAQLASDAYDGAVVPSKMDFPFLNSDVHEMTEEVIYQTIQDFGQATRRVLEAGFDGLSFMRQTITSSNSSSPDIPTSGMISGVEVLKTAAALRLKLYEK